MHSGADGKERMLRHSRTSHITVVTRDKGYGTVRIDKRGLPVINYSISPYDQESLMAGLVQSLRVLIAAGALEVGTQQLRGERFKAKGKVLQTLTLISDFNRNRVMSGQFKKVENFDTTIA